MVNVIFLGFLCLLSAVSGKDPIGVPQQLTIVQPVRPRSVEIMARVVVNSLGQQALEPCAAHVVQKKLSAQNEAGWNFNAVTEIPGGRFLLEGLEPGQSYQVRVACKVIENGQSRVGEFSLPVSVNTPRNNAAGGQDQGHDHTGHDHASHDDQSSDEKDSGSTNGGGGTGTAPLCVLLMLGFALAVKIRV